MNTLPVPHPLPVKPGLALPFWYNHLLFNPTLARPFFPPELLNESKSPPSGLPRDDPKLPLLAMSALLESILSLRGEAEKGLPLPEALRALPKGEETLASRGLPRPERGEARACTRIESAKLPVELTERGVALREYLGGVTY